MNVTGQQPAQTGPRRELRAPVRGTVVAVDAVPGQVCRAEQALLVLAAQQAQVQCVHLAQAT